MVTRELKLFNYEPICILQSQCDTQFLSKASNLFKTWTSFKTPRDDLNLFISVAMCLTKGPRLSVIVKLNFCYKHQITSSNT